MANTTRKTTDGDTPDETPTKPQTREAEMTDSKTSDKQTSDKHTSDKRTSDKRTSAPKPKPESESEQDGKAQSKGNASPGPMVVLRGAREQLAELTGMTPESVSSFERTDDGWLLEVEVLELARVPDTMSLLASYEVQLDPQGELTGYRRLRRYERGRSEPRGAGR
jgi:hypothetical protein